eukprot:3508329-Pleurochrysis_carterae.AAC.1
MADASSPARALRQLLMGEDMRRGSTVLAAAAGTHLLCAVPWAGLTSIVPCTLALLLRIIAHRMLAVRLVPPLQGGEVKDPEMVIGVAWRLWATQVAGGVGFAALTFPVTLVYLLGVLHPCSRLKDEGSAVPAAIGVWCLLFSAILALRTTQEPLKMTSLVFPPVTFPAIVRLRARLRPQAVFAVRLSTGALCLLVAALYLFDRPLSRAGQSFVAGHCGVARGFGGDSAWAALRASELVRWRLCLKTVATFPTHVSLHRLSSALLPHHSAPHP